ncbi:MAG: putative F420-0 ABC transporter substrate-binding protein [Rhodoglobus sp.]
MLAAALALSGCASAGSPTPTPTIDAAAPIIIDNCGVSVTFDSAPERVVTIKSSTTELLLALGLGDRIIGTAFQDGPVPAQWEPATDIPSISDFVPNEEAVLELEPDLVFGGWESNFSSEGVGERAELESLGVNTYVAPSACLSIQPPKLTWDDVFGDITEVASVFRVDASALVADQQARVDALLADQPGGGRTALWYSSGDDTPYVGAGIGAPQLVLETLGLVNIAADVNATWAPLNWEVVVDADPDVIVLVDATWNTAEAKIAMLESNPATQNLSAVKAKRYLIVPFAATEAGVRSVEAAESLRDQLAVIDGS